MDKRIVKEPTIRYGKKIHRGNLKDLPYPEKVKIVVQLQKIAAPILNARGENVTPWKIY